MNKLFKSLLGCLFLSACATLPKEDCTTSDWQKIGQQDGINGYEREFIRQHQKNCAAAISPVDQQLYLIGWDEGNQDYCTAENGYVAGLNGAYSGKVCAAEVYPEYNEQFKIGHQVYILCSRRKEIQAQIEKNNEDRSLIANVSRGLAIWNGYSPTESLDQRKAELDEKIMAIDANAPGGPKVAAPGDNEVALKQAIGSLFHPNDPKTAVNTTSSIFEILHGLGSEAAFQETFPKTDPIGPPGTLAALNAAPLYLRRPATIKFEISKPE